jgi:hypothetical protein
MEMCELVGTRRYGRREAGGGVRGVGCCCFMFYGHIHGQEIHVNRCEGSAMILVSGRVCGSCPKINLVFDESLERSKETQENIICSMQCSEKHGDLLPETCEPPVSALHKPPRHALAPAALRLFSALFVKSGLQKRCFPSGNLTAAAQASTRDSADGAAAGLRMPIKCNRRHYFEFHRHIHYAIIVASVSQSTAATHRR